MRQQQAQQRRSKLEAITATAEAEARQNPQLRRQLQAMSATSRSRDPNRGIITQAEWNELVEKREESGTLFRYVFALLILASVVLLALFKYDEEFVMELPQIVSGREFGEVRHAETDAGQISVADVDSYYRVLGVENRPTSIPNGEETAKDDPDKQRRLENYRVRQNVKRAFHGYQEQQKQLVYCGRACEVKEMQVELAYNKLVSQVDRELFGVLLDAHNSKEMRSASPQLLKEKYEAKKIQIEREESNEELRDMALEELKDAYEIIQDPEARKYYLLYGAKPPEFMRHVSARHGGWGQEITLGTFKYRLIIMWLDYLHDKIGLWGETAVLLGVVVLVLMRLPYALKQSEAILEQFEDHQRNQQEDKDE